MKKRLFAAVLTVCMVLAVLTVTVFATDEATQVADYDALVNALEAGGNVVLTADITIDTKITVADGTTIDLNNKTLYINVENSYYNNVTIKNGNIVLGKDDVHVCDGYFLVNEGKTLVLNGVNVSSADGGIKGYAVFHLKTGANLDLVDSELTISDNEYKNGYIVYAGESTATLDVTGTTITGTNVNGIVHATTVIKESTFDITSDGTTEHGINRSAVTIEDSTVSISGGSGRGITAQHGDLVIKGDSVVTVSNMGEATIQLQNNVDLTVEDTATVSIDKAVNNTTSGTVSGTVNVDAAVGKVAKIGDVYYTDFETALKAVTENAVLEILSDITITKDWDCRYTGAKITVPVTINGNGYTIKFTGKISDGYNHFAAFRFEAPVTVKNLTIDMSEAEAVFQNKFRAISTKANLSIDNCKFIGSTVHTKTRAIIYGEGSGDAISDLVVSIKNSEFTNWGYGVTDNENGQDAKSVVVESNEFTNAGVQISAAETVSFNNNEVSDAWVDIRSYSSENNLEVTAIENNLEADGAKKNYINAATLVSVQDEFNLPVAIIEGKTGYETLQKAIKAVGAGDVVIELLADATLDYGAREAYGTADTTSLTINGNSYTLTLNQTDSDWSSIGLANPDAKFVFNKLTIEKTGYGDTSGAWNTHAVWIKSNVEMTDVIINNSLAVNSGAVLNNVKINETNGYYGLWICGNGQTVDVNGGSITATNGGRGIKIADEYVNDAVAQVTLNVTGTVFNTAKKAAVLVSSTAGARVTANGCDISGVAEDKENFVWVDEEWSAYYNNVKVYGEAAKTQESANDFPIVVHYNNAEGSIRAYFNTLDELFSAPATQVPGTNYIDLRGDVVAENKVNVSYASNRVYTFGTSVEGGVTMTFNYADNWNLLPKFDLGENITMNVPYLQVIGGDISVAGTINTNYLYLYGTGEGVTIEETGVVNANVAGDKTVQVKGGTVLTVKGILNTGTLNVWTQDVNNSVLIVSGENAEVNASHTHAWNGKDGVSSQSIIIENGATYTSANFQADRGSIVTVDDAILSADTLTFGLNLNDTVTVNNNGVIDADKITFVCDFEITEGTWIGELTRGSDGVTLEISGGIFSEDPTEYLVDGYVPYTSPDGLYGVIEGEAEEETGIVVTADLTFTVLPEEAAEYASVKITKNDKVIGTSAGTYTGLPTGEYEYTVTSDGYDTESGSFDLSEYMTYEVVLNLIVRDITVNKNGNGDVKLVADSPVVGDVIEIITSPDRDNELESITVTTESGAEIELTEIHKGIFTFIMPAEGVIITVEFVEEESEPSWWSITLAALHSQKYTITATAGEGGKISNEGRSEVGFSGMLKYTIKADEGYEIADVIVDGKSVGAVSEYTFKRVKEAHTISVVFEEIVEEETAE